ncbi:hypothetical protein E2C01_043500 [Portunus trituberculatus]|uniref:Uncharacterized protein n=1 Tax=Portunus trituberculatus TaxID=210409 RepID=A0A5B7FXR1_PORTR|nr:hypothetical protein [Portunus trituberculatus]
MRRRKRKPSTATLTPGRGDEAGAARDSPKHRVAINESVRHCSSPAARPGVTACHKRADGHSFT